MTCLMLKLFIIPSSSFFRASCASSFVCQHYLCILILTFDTDKTFNLRLTRSHFTHCKYKKVILPSVKELTLTVISKKAEM